MGASTLQERILKIAEAKVTHVVNRVLARNYRMTVRRKAGVQALLASLDIAGREETEALREEIHGLQSKIKEFSSRLEALRPSSGEEPKVG